MKNFIFKSTAADLQKMFSILENLQKNMLYTTYKMDKILKLVNSLEINSRCEKEANTFYQGESHLGPDGQLEDTEHIPEEKPWSDSSEERQ